MSARQLDPISRSQRHLGHDDIGRDCLGRNRDDRNDGAGSNTAHVLRNVHEEPRHRADDFDFRYSVSDDFGRRSRVVNRQVIERLHSAVPLHVPRRPIEAKQNGITVCKRNVRDARRFLSRIARHPNNLNVSSWVNSPRRNSVLSFYVARANA